MFRRRRSTQRRTQSFREQRPNEPKIQQSIGEGGASFGRPPLQYSSRPVPKLSGRHEFVEQTHLQRLSAAQRSTFQHEFECRANSHGANGSYGTPEAGMYAEQHLRQSQGKRCVVRADPVGARQRKFETAAEHESVQRRDAGARHIFDRIDDGLARPHQLIALGGSLDRLEFLDVRAGDEAVRLARAHDESARRALTNLA
jgi:hypothetical protein